ncbi:ATPase family AAA domain-containing protein 5 [Aricia agestis]|uniref:ATPase family AAA domain-containing protein 5 n=1 Tax=Aricia agestis TaxID=91739 RepID=UPI001C20255B|nr:ATPase family AAA domain-containing protein 5 [Aricia agestis]
MSSFLEVTQLQHSSKIPVHKPENTVHAHNILKSKENVFKSKCNKALKNKLKKYKLRKDGKEDEDIIDVSKTLISSLKIKSPNGQEAKLPIEKAQTEERLPKNYLFKMVRKKNDSSKPAMEGTPSILENKHTPLPESKNNESKHTNAFQLLMDSRNKSIGGNSPGKDKHIEIADESELIRKKELKAKRNLVLQQMAQKKGLAKNLENEEFIDECIKRQLVKRADRLKEMITLNIPKNDKPRNGLMKEKSNLNNGVNIKVKENTVKSNKLQLFNFLSDDENSVAENHNSNSKMSNEDEEFLKKLGPSIKKKENMLSYFQKVEKKDISGSGSEMEINDNNNSENSVIKVKFVPKHKKKKPEVNSRSDPTVNTVDFDSKLADTPQNEPNDELNNSSINCTPTRKRKRDKSSRSKISKTEDIQAQDENINSRPKRNTKKPIKYTDDAMLSSSDDELIFTPVKKKIINKRLDCKDQLQNHVIVPENKLKSKSTLENSDSKSKKIGTKTNIKIESKKPPKLAPIFSTKSKLTPSEQAAKESFLKSGVPDKLKIKHKESTNVLTWSNYYATVHVQQNEACKEYNTYLKIFDWIDTSDNIKNIGYNEDCKFYLQLIDGKTEETKDEKILLKYKPENLLSYIKKSYSKFPVYRTFHSLKTKSRAETKDINVSSLDNSIEIVKDIVDFNYDYTDKLSWNEKYKPISSKQIIGNFDSVKELKRWLESWSENQNTKGKNDDSDLSDFCFSDSDTNSRDPFKHTNNVLIISGRSGTGKTSCVYAVAAELAIKVIEVNASSKRTGKIMLQDLQEATQSHKVNRGNNKKESSQNSQSSQENFMASKIFKKRGRPKKTYERKPKQVEPKEVEIISSSSQQSQTSSQESSRTESSLILIDDADIVFDQDDGFCSAISQLINYSKRPVILITSSLSVPHLQKYISFGKVIKMNPLLPKMLGTWLDIMCLADTNTCYPGFGCRILDYFRGDIRKTINFLQFHMTSNKHLNEIEEGAQDTDFKANIDNSSMSWVDQESEDVTKEVDDNEIKKIADKQMLLLNSHNFDLFNVWWSLSNQFTSENQKENKDINSGMSLDDASYILDSISFVDSIDINTYSKANLTSKPWESFQCPSVMERENMDSYGGMYEVNRNISREIIERFTSLVENWNRTLISSPSMSTQRKRNKIVSQHNTLSRYLSPSSTLDRRALSLDYWSSCRTICRLEKKKTDSNLKRNNRFCHYLRSLNILCKNDNFDDLCEGLN